MLEARLFVYSIDHRICCHLKPRFLFQVRPTDDNIPKYCYLLLCGLPFNSVQYSAPTIRYLQFGLLVRYIEVYLLFDFNAGPIITVLKKIVIDSEKNEIGPCDT